MHGTNQSLYFKRNCTSILQMAQTGYHLLFLFLIHYFAMLFYTHFSDLQNFQSSTIFIYHFKLPLFKFCFDKSTCSRALHVLFNCQDNFELNWYYWFDFDSINRI